MLVGCAGSVMHSCGLFYSWELNDISRMLEERGIAYPNHLEGVVVISYNTLII